jgi:hypothetical protein
VQIGAVKIIYVAALEALRQKERQDETQLSPKLMIFSDFYPVMNANVLFFAGFKKNLTQFMTKGFSCWFFITLQTSLL